MTKRHPHRRRVAKHKPHVFIEDHPGLDKAICQAYTRGIEPDNQPLSCIAIARLLRNQYDIDVCRQTILNVLIANHIKRRVRTPWQPRTQGRYATPLVQKRRGQFAYASVSRGL